MELSLLDVGAHRVTDLLLDANRNIFVNKMLYFFQTVFVVVNVFINRVKLGLDAHVLLLEVALILLRFLHEADVLPKFMNKLGLLPRAILKCLVYNLKMVKLLLGVVVGFLNVEHFLRQLFEKIVQSVV